MELPSARIGWPLLRIMRGRWRRHSIPTGNRVGSTGLAEYAPRVCGLFNPTKLRGDWYAVVWIHSGPNRCPNCRWRCELGQHLEPARDQGSLRLDVCVGPRVCCRGRQPSGKRPTWSRDQDPRWWGRVVVGAGVAKGSRKARRNLVPHEDLLYGRWGVDRNHRGDCGDYERRRPELEHRGSPEGGGRTEPRDLYEPKIVHRRRRSGSDYR